MTTGKIFSLNMARICIDECQGRITGRVYSKPWPTPINFFGLGEMVVAMDRMFDKYRYPQAFQERRSFREPTGRAGPWRMPEARLSDMEMEHQQGRRYTFDIVVQSRRQSGWQGLLMQTDRTILTRFNNERELLKSICRELEERERKRPTG